MKKNREKTSLMLVLALILVLCVLIYYGKQEEKIEYLQIKFENAQIMAEIANTPKEIEQGLMFREYLGKDKGMIFIFKEEKETSFWMRNTLIPLDMIFLNKEKIIVNIVENAVPCTTEECLLYPSQIPVKYVIEVNAGFVKENRIKVGDEVEF